MPTMASVQSRLPKTSSANKASMFHVKHAAMEKARCSRTINCNKGDVSRETSNTKEEASFAGGFFFCIYAKTLARRMYSGSSFFLFVTASCKSMATTLPRWKPKTTLERPERIARAAFSPSWLAFTRSMTDGVPPR